MTELQILLAAIEQKGLEKNKEDYVAMKQLAEVVRKALGMEEQKNCAPAPIPQAWQPEWPQIRVRYDSSGNELGRRTINNLEEFRLMLQEEPMLVTWLPLR